MPVRPAIPTSNPLRRTGRKPTRRSSSATSGSGRIIWRAVHPDEQRGIIYVGAASGGVWKTVNGGASWQPIFDNEGSFSIGWVTIDPKQPERRLGRHRRAQLAALGRLRRRRLQVRGRRQDRGRTSASRTSEHIGRIVIDPKNPDIVYVAAQGPLWARGRRPRPLQDDRRRQDVEAGPEDQREHRRHRRRARSAQSRRRRRRVVPAPPAFLHPDRRRPGERHPPQHRRRQDVEEGDHRPARRGARPHRPRDLAGQPRRRLRQRRGREPQGRHLPLDRQRRHVGEAHRLQPRARCTTATSSPIRSTSIASTSPT